MFVRGVKARSESIICGINKNSAAYFFHKLRLIIAKELEDDSPLAGEVELDESYFGGHRKGKRGRGAGGKTPVFGILERGRKVFTKMIEDTSAESLLPIIKKKVRPDAVVYTDSWRAYDALDISFFEHHRVNHQHQFPAGKGAHINGIENFWSQAQRQLRRYNGIPKKSFYLFLKECEFRFNFGNVKEQLNTLGTWKKKTLS